jgi:DNA-binding LacI/PurR family transcriptional regulator
VGFDNVPATTFVRPRLTTIAQHPAAMGTRLANLLFDRIEHGYEGPSRVYQVVLDLIERDTT